MSTDHTLKRILAQISEHKQELGEIPPEDLLSEKTKQDETPIANVEEFFDEEELKKRAEETKEHVSPPIVTDVVPRPPSLENPTIGHPNYTPLEDLPPEEKKNLEEKKEKYEFRSVFDFKDFILMFYEKFDDFQKAALNSIVTVCDTIEVGCKCKRNTRLKVAEDYYIEFVTQNQDSGILEKFKELLNTKRIKFYSKDKLFLER